MREATPRGERQMYFKRSKVNDRAARKREDTGKPSGEGHSPGKDRNLAPKATDSRSES